MAEHDRARMDRSDRVDEAQDALRDRNIVRDGGIARSDADIEDVTRDTYGSPGDRDETARDVSDTDRLGAGDVLGISRDVPRDADDVVAPSSDSDRRRRSDDLMEDEPGQDTSGSSYDGPDGLKVRG
jgi:hypothetical protein